MTKTSRFRNLQCYISLFLDQVLCPWTSAFPYQLIFPICITSQKFQANITPTTAGHQVLILELHVSLYTWWPRKKLFLSHDCWFIISRKKSNILDHDALNIHIFVGNYLLPRALISERLHRIVKCNYIVRTRKNFTFDIFCIYPTISGVLTKQQLSGT